MADGGSVLISVVTPVYNGAAFLGRCLASVASEAASLPHGTVEHVVMDGGSTDGSAELAREHQRAYPWLVSEVRSGRDGGQSAAINAGMRLARGRWAAWLNADDWYEPGALAAVADAIRREPGADVVVGRARMVDASGAVVWAPHPPEPISLGNLLRLGSVWFAGRNLVQPEVFFRRELFLRVGGLEVANAYSMDHVLWAEMAAAGARFAVIDRLLASQAVHPGQKTARRYESRRCTIEAARRVLERHEGRLGVEAAAVRRDIDAFEALVESMRDELMRS